MAATPIHISIFCFHGDIVNSIFCVILSSFYSVIMKESVVMQIKCVPYQSFQLNRVCLQGKNRILLIERIYQSCPLQLLKYSFDV